MPLFVKGEPVGNDILSVKSLVEKFPHIETNTHEFISQPMRKVGKSGLLYVIQREFATVTPEDDQVTIIGSEDATTCHIIILRDKGSGVTSLAHLDGCEMADGISRMINSVAELSGNEQQPQQMELYLFGGFLDDRGTSASITQEIMGVIHDQGFPIHLCTACVTDLNDTIENGLHKPVIYGVGVDVKTGEIFHAAFSDKGPDQSLRHARHFTGGRQVLEVYSSMYQELRIGPFNYDTAFPHAASFMVAPPDLILKYLSTSPHCEPAGFVDDIRCTMKFIVENPDPMKTVFPHGTPHTYKRDSGGGWAEVDVHNA